MSVYLSCNSCSVQKPRGSMNGYKPFSSESKAKPSDPFSKFSKYSQQLIKVQQITESVQQSLSIYHSRASELSKRNSQLSQENCKLRNKIESMRNPVKAKPFDLLSPSNTSLRTQETEAFKSPNESISVSSCSSSDSILILKDQVEHVKEFKHVKRAQKKITIHRKTNSIGSSKDQEMLKKPNEANVKMKQESKIKVSKSKLKAKSILEHSHKARSTTRSLVYNALLLDIPVLRFN